SSSSDQKNDSSDVVEELKYRCSLKIALDILNPNDLAGQVPPPGQGPDTQLSQESRAEFVSYTPLRRCRLLFHSKEKSEPEASKKKRKQKNNPGLKADMESATQKDSFVLEGSAEVQECKTNLPERGAGRLCDASNLACQNHKATESKSLPRAEKIRGKSKSGKKVSPKCKERKNNQGGKRLRGAGSPLSSRNWVQPRAEEVSALPVPHESAPAVPARRADTTSRSRRTQPRRTLLGSSCESASDDLEKRLHGESRSLAKRLNGRKKPASLKGNNGERERGVAAPSRGTRSCRRFPKSSSAPSNPGTHLSSKIVSPESLSHLSALVDEEEEDEELPCILSLQEPQSMEEGTLGWCKLRRYPYWPAVVKKVKRKHRRACVLLIEGNMNDKKKGFSVSLKNLKHFDCEEKQDLIERAKEDYRQEIEWCIRLISDYRIRVGCHSFTGSFLEYFAADISYPVRKEGYQGPAQMTFPNVAEGDHEESPSEASPQKPSKKLLPDRTRAARDRANKKIVEFIVKTKGAEEHLLAILKSRKQSRWLKEFLNSSQYVTCIETYLEDEEQLDLVVNYLKEVYREMDTNNLHRINGDGIKFISDVLLPEAIIYAISAVDDIDYKKAEEKYIKGPSVSKR
ncbi:MUM1 protein, partial [Aegotheles bennettii]|nr:MUM1 protein [Aegotheles bennettii]